MLNLLSRLASLTFLVGWTLCVGGRILRVVERSLVRRGSLKAARRGPLLARERAWVPNGKLHKKRIDLEQALARWTSGDTLLFAPTGNYHPFALQWFGRGHRTANGFVMEARVSIGETISLLGLIILLLAVAIMSALAGGYWPTLVITAIAVLLARSYRRSFRDQTHLARRILHEIRGKLERGV